MAIFIRADASVYLGTGHIVRCMTMADMLRRIGRKVYFISRELPGNLCDWCESQGFPVFRISNPCTLDVDEFDPKHDAECVEKLFRQYAGSIEWLIVDHYGIDQCWETMIHPFVLKIMVIDDLANRPHECDVLLDQNLHENPERRYAKLIPEYCKTFFGPQYALLRQEFHEARSRIRKRDGNIKRILLFFGGSDPTNETAKVLRVIRTMDRPDLEVAVIVGQSNCYKDEVYTLCQELPNASYYCQVTNMAELMNWADLAIGAGGSTTWERCYLGLPSLTVIIAANQREVTESVTKAGATLNLGFAKDITEGDIQAALEYVFKHPQKLREISVTALKIMDEPDTGKRILDMFLEG